MRASRLLTIQMLLQTRGRLSASELAGLLEVSVRTLHRDIDQLSAAGVPVYAERGRQGGFALMEGWKTTLTGLTSSEAQAVFLTGLARPAADLGLAAQQNDAQLKLLAALPEAQRSQAQRMAQRFHLDPVDWYRESEPTPHLQAVAAALWNDQDLLIDYDSWKSRTKKRVLPLGLVLKAGQWYLVAQTNGKPRSYRIANVLAAAPQEQSAPRPKGFDLARYWAESVQRFESDLYPSTAMVSASERGLKQLRYLSAAVAKAVAAAPAPVRGKDRVTLSIPIESIDHATGQLLRLAPEVKVLSPATLVRALETKAREVVACYTA